jgi:hypothetical protein
VEEGFTGGFLIHPLNHVRSLGQSPNGRSRCEWSERHSHGALAWLGTPFHQHFVLDKRAPDQLPVAHQHQRQRSCRCSHPSLREARGLKQMLGVKGKLGARNSRQDSCQTGSRDKRCKTSHSRSRSLTPRSYPPFPGSSRTRRWCNSIDIIRQNAEVLQEELSSLFFITAADTLQSCDCYLGGHR